MIKLAPVRAGIKILHESAEGAEDGNKGLKFKPLLFRVVGRQKE